MKKILLCCASGIATSTAVKLKLTKMLDEKGYRGEYTITQCGFHEIQRVFDHHDFCVTTLNLKDEVDCPIILGVALLTGRGLHEVTEQIVEQMER